DTGAAVDRFEVYRDTSPLLRGVVVDVRRVAVAFHRAGKRNGHECKSVGTLRKGGRSADSGIGYGPKRVFFGFTGQCVPSYITLRYEGTELCAAEVNVDISIKVEKIRIGYRCGVVKLLDICLADPRSTISRVEVDGDPATLSCRIVVDMCRMGISRTGSVEG